MLKQLISKFRKPKEGPPTWEFKIGPKTMVAGDVLNLTISRVEGDDIKCSFAAIHTCTVKGVEDIIAEVDKGSLITQADMLTLYVWLANTKGRNHATEILGFISHPVQSHRVAFNPFTGTVVSTDAIRPNRVDPTKTTHPSETVLLPTGWSAPRDSDRA